mgnify:CR=1
MLQRQLILKAPVTRIPPKQDYTFDLLYAQMFGGIPETKILFTCQ